MAGYKQRGNNNIEVEKLVRAQVRADKTKAKHKDAGEISNESSNRLQSYIHTYTCQTLINSSTRGTQTQTITYTIMNNKRCMKGTYQNVFIQTRKKLNKKLKGWKLWSAFLSRQKIKED